MYAVVLDSSSSSCKASLVDKNGKICKHFSLDIETITYPDGRVEHDPKEIISKQLCVLEKLVEGISKESLVGIGISSQRETIVAWDKDTLIPIGNAISWQDSRDKNFFNKYKNLEEIIQKKTGLYFSEYFSVSKIKWILDNISYPISKIRVGTIDTWLLSNLTKGKSFFTDVTNASRTLLFNLEKESWDPELLDIFKIPSHILPEIKNTFDDFGAWRDIPIRVLIGDQQAALRGAAQKPGQVICTYGTGLFLLVNRGVSRSHIPKTITTIAWKTPNQATIYASELPFFSCGNFLCNLQKKGYFADYQISNLEIDDSFYLIDNGKKILRNINEENTRGEKLLKSVINALVLKSKDLINYFSNYLKLDSIINISGGLTRFDYLGQTQAHLLNKTICRFNAEKNSCQGVADLIFKFSGIIDNEISSSGKNYFPSPNLVPESLIKAWEHLYNSD